MRKKRYVIRLTSIVVALGIADETGSGMRCVSPCNESFSGNNLTCGPTRQAHCGLLHVLTTIQCVVHIGILALKDVEQRKPNIRSKPFQVERVKQCFQVWFGAGRSFSVVIREQLTSDELNLAGRNLIETARPSLPVNYWRSVG